MNMTTTAERFFISQSAISQTINDLEAHYDVRLFERLSRKLYLTSAGEKLYGYARHMIGMNADIEKEMKALTENGAIRIGASVTIATYVLPTLIAFFKQTNTNIDITVCEDNTNEIEKRLLSDKADIGLVEGEIVSPDVVSAFFSGDELTLICSHGHRFAGMPVIEPRELEKEDFIIREPGSGTRKTFEDAMTARGILWNEKWVCNSMDTIKEAVMAGLGVSVIPKIAAQNEIHTGKLCAKPVKDIRFSRTFKIAYHKNKYLTSAMKKFIDFCADNIKMERDTARF